MKNQLKSVLSLLLICATVAVMLAVTNYITAPIIKANEDKAAEAALLKVLPGGEEFSKIDISSLSLPASVREVHCEKNGGYVFKLEVSGYSAGMIVMCGVTADGKISGALCLSSGETLGYEKTYGDRFTGLASAEIPDTALISGATKTTSAYKNAIHDALYAYEAVNIAKGDMRS